MENKKLASGSALLAVIITMTILTIIAGTVLRSATLLNDFALERMRNEQRVWATQALLHYGIAWCKMIDAYEHKEPRYEKKFDRWPLAGEGIFSGILTVRLEQNKYVIQAQLLTQKGVVNSVECTLTKTNEWLIH